MIRQLERAGPIVDSALRGGLSIGWIRERPRLELSRDFALLPSNAMLLISGDFRYKCLSILVAQFPILRRGARDKPREATLAPPFRGEKLRHEFLNSFTSCLFPPPSDPNPS